MFETVVFKNEHDDNGNKNSRNLLSTYRVNLVHVRADIFETAERQHALVAPVCHRGPAGVALDMLHIVIEFDVERLAVDVRAFVNLRDE